MLIALLVLLGADLIAIVVLLHVVPIRRRWVSRQPGARKAASSTARVSGLGSKWKARRRPLDPRHARRDQGAVAVPKRAGSGRRPDEGRGGILAEADIAGPVQPEHDPWDQPGAHPAQCHRPRDRRGMSGVVDRCSPPTRPPRGGGRGLGTG